MKKQHKQRTAGREPRRGISRFLGLLLILAGAVLLSFPFVANFIASRQAGQVISDQQNAVAALNAEQLDAEWEKARAYNDSLTGEPVTDPFIPGSGAALPSTDAYMDALNVNGDGVMGSLDIDMIDVHLPIGHDATDNALLKGVGHIRQTSLPIGGPTTHAVLAGHRGLPNAEMFTRLDEMQVGDTFTITVLGKKMTYQVDKISVVLPSDLSKIAVERDRDLVTLMTCTPYGVNTHRLLVRGTRIPNEDAPEPRLSMGLEPLARILGFIIGIALIIMLLILFSRRRRTDNHLPGMKHQAPRHPD